MGTRETFVNGRTLENVVAGISEIQMAASMPWICFCKATSMTTAPVAASVLLDSSIANFHAVPFSTKSQE
jgi:hypothetical protein